MPRDVDLAELTELTIQDYQLGGRDMLAINARAQKALNWIVTKGALQRGTIVAFPKAELSVGQLAAFRLQHIERMEFAVFQDDRKLYVKARPRTS